MSSGSIVAPAFPSVPIRKVKRVQFGILSPEEIVWSFFSVPLNDQYLCVESQFSCQD